MCPDYKIIPLGEIQDWMKLSQYNKKIRLRPFFQVFYNVCKFVKKKKKNA